MRLWLRWLVNAQPASRSDKWIEGLDGYDEGLRSLIEENRTCGTSRIRRITLFWGESWRHEEFYLNAETLQKV